MSFFTYKGYPLVRKDKELYFGNMYDEYVVWMQIQETRKLQDLDVASKIKIYLMRTDEKLYRKSTRLNSSHYQQSRMPSSA